ncbi:hypothetical protein B0H17DRAFT_1000461 [Mycena rosella]|uniref:BZIP domain-containing protein n=1 Tax=Mycena rosella TaxID=1033263 RepID=A0AAD7GXN0_MYCRO|nr:hypothetical protein B0H17DRAFT_1000461 [Mycena rosella]
MDEPRQILASTTETSLTAQSSHLFQNAAGFDIVGGHFVSGDLHYHAVPESSALGPTHRPLTLPTPTPPVHGREAFASSGPFLDVTSEHAESEIYCSQLLRRKRGFPLYVPGPQRNLPTEYQRKGVSIGDVGRVTPEGVFDFFFNIYLPADHPINANDVPEDFSPLTPYVPKDLVHVDFDPGSYVSSYSVQELDPGSDSPADIDFPGSEFRFNCKGPTGALLSLPHGAQLEKLENVEHARRYAAKNAESWYRYVNGTRGRRLVNGDLYLITGCEKSQSGGMASFENVTAGSEFQLLFKPITSSGSDAGYKYRFKRGTPAHTRTFFSSTHLNHTTFIHGLTISIGEGIWGRLLGGVGISQITDFQSPKSHSNFVPFGSQGSLFSWSLGFFGGGAATGGGKYRGQSGEEVGITDLSLIPKIFHPGRLINNLIFRESPDAKVVITHDDDWGHILHDDDTECTIQNGNEFLERILEMFAITEEDGATFIVFKPDPNLNIGELEESAMPVSSLNSLHSIISSHTSYNLGQRRKDELPLQQHRTYTIPSLTSKKEIPAYFATRRSLSQPSDEEEDELTEEPPAANVTDQEKIEYKRRQNTLPARRSRKRKLMHQQQLEEAVERCLFCRGRQFACMPAVGGAQGCG